MSAGATESAVSLTVPATKPLANTFALPATSFSAVAARSSTTEPPAPPGVPEINSAATRCASVSVTVTVAAVVDTTTDALLSCTVFAPLVSDTHIFVASLNESKHTSLIVSVSTPVP